MRLRPLLPALLMFCGPLGGCDKLTGADKIEVVKSKDGTTKIEMPGNWKVAKSINAEADIQVSDVLENTAVIVLSESKEDFTDDVDLQEFSNRTRSILKEGWDEYAEVEGPTELQIGGLPGLQYKLEGADDGVRSTSLHTSIEGATRYHQILAVTSRSQFSSESGLLQKVTSSFREVSGEGGDAKDAKTDSKE